MNQAISNATLSCDSIIYFIYELPTLHLIASDRSKIWTPQTLLPSIELPYPLSFLDDEPRGDPPVTPVILISGWCITQAVSKRVKSYDIKKHRNFSV